MHTPAERWNESLIRRPTGAQSNGSFRFRGQAPPANFRCASGAELRVESLITSRTFSFNFVSNVFSQSQCSALSLDHSIEAQQIEHEMTWMMEIFDAFWPSQEIFISDFPVPGIDPDR
jgi:hypothetical protein